MRPEVSVMSLCDPAPQNGVAWRCSTCGKWSHAQRRPKWHRRWTQEEPPEGTVVIEHLEPSYDHYSNYEPDYWIVQCGPFEKYLLMKYEES